MGNPSPVVPLACLALALLVIGAVILFVIPDRSATGDDIETRTNDDPGAGDGAGEADGTGDHAGTVNPADAADEASNERIALDPTRPMLRGRVIDAMTGDPVTAFRVRLSRMDPANEPGGKKIRKTVATESFANESGSFDFPLDEGGSFRVRVYSSRHLRRDSEEVTVIGADQAGDLVVSLEPGASVSGTVVEDATGRPVEGALIAVDRITLARIRNGEGEISPHTETDEQGRFLLRGLKVGRARQVGAVHDDFAQGWIMVAEPGRTGPVEIRLKRGFHLHGTVRDDAGEPCPGAEIILNEKDAPLYRYARTAADGSYRTAPAAPGEVEARAGPPWPRGDFSLEISCEWKHATIVDSDVRIDFGPLAEHCSWTGTFYGYDGEPNPRGHVHLFRKPGNSGYIHEFQGNRHSIHCDAQGRFVARRLLPGIYSVYPVADDSDFIDDWDPLVLEPGEQLEKDIRLDHVDGVPGAEIRGVIVDSATGLKPDVDFIHIMASRRSYNRNYVNASIDEKGAFRIRPLPPGFYDIHVYADGYRPESHAVRLKAGEIRDDCRLEIRRGGRLVVKLTGFEMAGDSRFAVHMRHETGIGSSFRTRKVNEKGELLARRDVLAGCWTVTVTGEDAGLAVRSVTVVAGGEEEVLIRPEDLTGGSGTVTVDGSLAWGDGSPVPDVRIAFDARQVPGITRSGNAVEVETKTDGSFSASGIAQGRWVPTVKLGDGTSITFPSVLISGDGTGPFELPLVIPPGTVSGTVVDDLTGQPIAAQAAGWILTARPRGTGWESRLDGTRGGKSAFLLPGVPAGSFLLSVSSPGFEWYTSEPIAHPGRGNLELGTIRVRRSGSLLVEVLKPGGLPIETFSLFVDGELAHGRKRSRDGGAHFYDWLRPGERVIEVSASGFRKALKRITIEAGAPTELCLILEPE